VTAPVNPRLEAAAERAERRRGFLLALPSYVYLIILFALPLVIIGVYSFASRSRTGRPRLEAWNLDAWAKLMEPAARSIAMRSLVLALLTTLLCLVVAYPFAYYLATRTERVRNTLLILVMIPFWSNFLVRTYAWRNLLGKNGLVTDIGEFLGLWGETLFTTPAVYIGLVYGFLPFMVLPLYAALERMDWSLVEAGRDLYASGWTAFRRITWPISRPGVVAGSILVFIPSLGAYVTPDILGGAKTTLMGNYIVEQFFTARNWPVGSAVSVAIMVVMLLATVFYFRSGAKTL
jgi:spermidine/putrescine transport system permease protein